MAMSMNRLWGAGLLLSSLAGLMLAGCPEAANDGGAEDREPIDAGAENRDPIEQGQSNARGDGAVAIPIAATGSLQNPAFSPKGDLLLLTRFVDGYNNGPADLLVVDVNGGAPRTLVSDGSTNVNLPGSSWNAATGQITFSSARDPHDEIYIISAQGRSGEERPVTSRTKYMSYEPALSPDGARVVFESHPLDVEGQGRILVHRLDGAEAYREITPAGQDCRQPNWSPSGDQILYQRLNAGQWDLWITDSTGANHRQLTTGKGDKTDASFSPDGKWIVYSSNEHGGDSANLYIIAVAGGPSTRATFFDGYDGAPSWSPDGERIAFESYAGDPDGTRGTTLWWIKTPLTAKP